MSELATELYEEQTFLQEEKEVVLALEEKREFVLREQKLGTDANTIAERLNTTYANLRAFMNRQGYRTDNGIFKPKNFKEDNYVQGRLDITEVGDDFVKSEIEPKKYVKISVDILDKFLEAYNWYLQVRDNPRLRTKANKRNKELCIQEDYSNEELVSLKASIPSSVANDFERFCANSNHGSSDILTQAITWYMGENSYLK